MASMIRTSRGFFSEAAQTDVDIMDFRFQVSGCRTLAVVNLESGIWNLELESELACKEDICLMLLK